jgi:hypothetical protein
MSNFKKASQIKLRFTSAQGLLTTEQIWDLNLKQLTDLIKGLKKSLNKSTNDESLSFLDDTFEVDKVAELRFEIAKEIYLAKKEELDLALNASKNKEHDQYILSLIAEKEKEELKGKSVEELQALLKNK